MSDKPDQLSAEDRQALDLIKQSGMTPAQVVYRAGKQMQAERAAQAAGDTGDGENETVTDADEAKEEAQRVRQTVRTETEMQERRRIVEDHVETAFGGTDFAKNLPENKVPLKVQNLQTEVASELVKNHPNWKDMSRAEFKATVKKLTDKVIKDEIDTAKAALGHSMSEADAAKQLKNQDDAATAAGGGGSGKVTKRSADADRTTPPDDNTYEVDRPAYGVGVKFPTEDELKRTKKRRIDQFLASEGG